MVNDSPKQSHREVRDLRPGLLEADDQKIRRVLAVVDDVSDPSVNKALLDPLRPRLAVLKPVRPLRFARLLFFPIDPLTVTGRVWRPGDPTVPRPALAPIARMVRAGLGDRAAVLEKMIAGRKADATEVVTRAGEMLWPRAAEILTSAPPPADWVDSGLSLAAYPQLSASIAAILRRAPQMRSLASDDELGTLKPDDDVLEEILRDITAEPAAGCAMIVRLLLLRSPHAVKLLVRFAGSGRTEEKALLWDAIDHGLEAELSHMERESGTSHAICGSGLAEVAGEARRATTLLAVLESDTVFSGHLPRVKAIRRKLDDACQTRFARGVDEELIAPLTGTAGPVNGTVQTALELNVRHLRKLETVARKLGSSAGYDRQLLLATDAVRMAAGKGLLTPMREFRLIEILAGSDAAETLYRHAAGGSLSAVPGR